MATTRLISMHLNQGKSIAQCLKDRTDYAKNPDKTAGGTWVTTYACDPRTVDAEWALSKREYFEITGRERKNEVIAYQVRQSFRPGEITPEEANRVGYELAERFLKGSYAFLVATHIDKSHIHNHILWNATSLDCTHKFRNFLGSGRAVARLSDQICLEHQLSVIADPQHRGKRYDQWLGEKAKPSQRERLRCAMDEALRQQPGDFEALLTMLQAAGWEIKRGKQISLRGSGEKRFKRLDTLGEGYSEAELRAVLAGKRTHMPRVRKAYQNKRQINLLVDIQAKLQEGKGAGYERWAKVFNLKQMARTMAYLSEHAVTSYEELKDKADKAAALCAALTKEQQATEQKMAANAALKTHILNYLKTREIFAAYKASGYSKKYLAAHEQEIRLHREAKEAFNGLGLKKLPTVKSLQEEYALLAAQKKKEAADYRQARKEKRELMTAKANIDRILTAEHTKQREAQERPTRSEPSR